MEILSFFFSSYILAIVSEFFCVAGSNKENCETAKLETSVNLSIFLNT